MVKQCIVVNYSVVIALAQINLLHVLIHLYNRVIVPAVVYEEVVIRGCTRPGSWRLRALRLE
ncbi:MAG: hypothetical protein J7K21_04755 [Desulfurococcales archaeon]|nr:hypothetical protein [Desulfurococcales archaeon]